MRDLAPNLREYFDAMADRMAPLVAEPTDRRSRRPSRRPVWAAAAAVLLVAALVAGYLVIRDPGDRAPRIHTPAGRDVGPFVDSMNGMSVSIPRGWHRDSPPPFTSEARLSVSTSAAQTKLCDGSRTPSIRIAMFEIPFELARKSASFSPRPTAFGPGTAPLQLGTTEANGCFSTIGVAPGQAFSFTDQDRAFQVVMTLYPGSPRKRQTQAYEILNSLQFSPSDTLSRPPVTLTGQRSADGE